MPLSFLLMVLLLGLGNTVGYHRLLTHRAFVAVAPLRWGLTMLGALHSGSPMMWVGLHRLHHARSDTDEDPHSPTAGFWWSHCGWIINTARPLPAILFAVSGFGQQVVIARNDLRRLLGRSPPAWRALCPDLMKEPLMRALDIPGVIPALFLAQVAIAGGLWGWTGIGGLWLAHVWLTNSSWAVNSIGHTARFGRRPFKTSEGSRDVPWLAVLTLGEGYHNGHHRYPRSARHALEGGADLSWQVIRGLAAVGLARDIWLPRRYR